MKLDYLVGAITVVAYAVFIVYTRRSQKTYSTFAVADRNVGWFMLFASMSANYIGPGFTLGLANEGYSSGYFMFAIIATYGIGKIFEGKIIAPRVRKKFAHAYSLGDIVAGDQSHNNRWVRLTVGILSLGLLTGFCAIMAKAGGDIAQAFLGVDPLYGIIIINIIVIGYSVFGSLKSSMLTDMVQFTIFVIMLPLLAIIVVLNTNTSYETFATTASALWTTKQPTMNAITIFGLVISWLMGEMLVPPTISGMLAGANPKTSRLAISAAGGFMIVWLLLMLTIGILAKIALPPSMVGDQILLHLGKTFYPDGLFGLFAIALIGVVMSTQDSLINGAAVVSSNDILNVIFPIQENKRLFGARLLGVGVGLLAIIFAYFIPSVISALLICYSVWVPAIAVVTLQSVFMRTHSVPAALAAMIGGASISLGCTYFAPQSAIPAVLLGLAGSLLLYASVYFGFPAKVKVV